RAGATASAVMQGPASRPRYNRALTSPGPGSGALFLRLIERWLKAGVLESGRWEPVEVGTPQGSGISPILANVFFHYVVDLWVNQWRRHRAAGQIVVCRYADDLVIGCQRGGDGKTLLVALKDRLAQFGLSLHE